MTATIYCGICKRRHVVQRPQASPVSESSWREGLRLIGDVVAGVAVLLLLWGALILAFAAMAAGGQ